MAGHLCNIGQALLSPDEPFIAGESDLETVSWFLGNKFKITMPMVLCNWMLKSQLQSDSLRATLLRDPHSSFC
jgi:hypothetical protein